MENKEVVIKIPCINRCDKYINYCKFNNAIIDNDRNVLITKWISDTGCMCKKETSIEYV